MPRSTLLGCSFGLEYQKDPPIAQGVSGVEASLSIYLYIVYHSPCIPYTYPLPYHTLSQSMHTLSYPIIPIIPIIVHHSPSILYTPLSYPIIVHTYPIPYKYPIPSVYPIPYHSLYYPYASSSHTPYILYTAPYIHIDMCGICLILNANISTHTFDFSFLTHYFPSPEAQIPLNEHILKHNLLLDVIDIQAIQRDLSKRGPDRLQNWLLHVPSADTHPNPSSQHSAAYAIGIQSILHLRGTAPHTNHTNRPLLYNGEVWSTGRLPPLCLRQNDTAWLSETLNRCAGDPSLYLDVLREIEGDYALIHVTPNRITIAKDYFGKRSLLIGMSHNKLIFSSVPVHSSKAQMEAEGDQEESDWMNKYKAQWTTSRHKCMFQIPSNTMLCLDIKQDTIHWSQHTVRPPPSITRLPTMTAVQAIQTCTKLLLDNMNELTAHLVEAGQHCSVMFSGGIDSSIIARLLDIVLPPNQQIHLINLSFRADAPDKQSGQSSLAQLRHLNPHRIYHYTQIQSNLQHVTALAPTLLRILYPKTTHMDFNIGAALHIASEAAHTRVVMSGLGADELFAGYSRYRVAYERAGYEAMEGEMRFDMGRLWVRNLGRDDRAISSNGKETRYPFLFVRLWEFMRRVPFGLITEGKGDKKLLQGVARSLGLEAAALQKKRAIQFGTRLAKLSNIQCFGSNRKANGKSQYM